MARGAWRAAWRVQVWETRPDAARGFASPRPLDEGNQSRKRTGSTLLDVLSSFAIASFILSHTAQLSHVQGSSMLPTLHDREIIVVERVGVSLLTAPLWRALTGRDRVWQRGDVVVMRSPRRVGENVVKRVVGLDGDVLGVPGRLMPAHVGAGQVWVEGDNAGHSLDSRSSYGAIPGSLVEGRALAVVWPLIRLGPGEDWYRPWSWRPWQWSWNLDAAAVEVPGVGLVTVPLPYRWLPQSRLEGRVITEGHGKDEDEWL